MTLPESGETQSDVLDSADDDELSAFTASDAAGALSGVARFVWPFLRRHRVGMSCVGLGLAVETLYNVIMPLGLMFLIDDALVGANFEALYVILGVLATAGIATSIVAVWYERWDARTSAAVVADLRADLFQHVQQLPVAFHRRTRHGEILSRFSIDMAAVEAAIKSATSTALLPLLEIIAGMGLLFWLNWQMAAMALLIFPVTLIGPRLLTPRAIEANYDQKVAESEILGTVQESIASQIVLKAFDLQQRAFGWFSPRNNAAQRKAERATFLTSMVERTVTISVLMLHLIVLAAGAYMATSGRISIGTFVTFESAFWEVSYNVTHLMQFVPVAIEAAGATQHIQELLDENKEAADAPRTAPLPPIRDGIQLEHVGFTFEGTSAPVFRDLNLTIPAGSSVAIVGRSGSGKTTLLHLIQRLYEPTKGRISIDGTDIQHISRSSLRAGMSAVFQDIMLLHMSIRENIRLGMEGASDEQVVLAAKEAEIHDYITGLQAGYDTLVGERGETLSGGQKQRIAIARALLRSPSVLLLDEATSALDPSTESAINQTLGAVAKGRTVISATHRLTSVVGMDEIIVIGDGGVLEQGTHTALLAKGGEYSRLWATQGASPEAYRL